MKSNLLRQAAILRGITPEEITIGWPRSRKRTYRKVFTA
jgi:hypothetical protein